MRFHKNGDKITLQKRVGKFIDEPENWLRHFLRSVRIKLLGPPRNHIDEQRKCYENI